MTPSEVPRAVFDCNIYVQAFLSESGPARECFRLAEDARVILLTSESVLDEVREVLTRPKLRRVLAEITAERIEQYLAWVRTISVVLAEVESIFLLERDPKDSKYVDLVIACKCGYLVSRDKDLLDLPTDSTFTSRFPSVTVLNPVAFLAKVRLESGEHESADSTSQ